MMNKDISSLLNAETVTGNGFKTRRALSLFLKSENLLTNTKARL